MTLYDQLGGAPAIEAVVDSFYQKILADDSISHFFAGMDMADQRKKQVLFVAFATGGAPKYPGRAMRATHKHLALTDDHFDAVAHHLAATLREFSVPEHLVSEVLHRVGSLRDDVLNR